MQDIIEKLLVLQDRDRKIVRLTQELTHIAPERDGLRLKAASTQTQLDAAKTRVKQIEAERKRLELEVESKKAQIDKYLNQQLQTRKNEEYRALAHEVEMAKEAIFKIEDQEIGLMEQMESAQKEVVKATAEAAAAKKRVEDEIGLLDQREANLKKELAELTAGRVALAGVLEAGTLARYERLFKNKGENVVVNIEHGVCGGCHMKLPPQCITSCRAQAAELVPCPNCGRILYFTAGMDLTQQE
jgi:uncharacterized protein